MQRVCTLCGAGVSGAAMNTLTGGERICGSAVRLYPREERWQRFLRGQGIFVDGSRRQWKGRLYIATATSARWSPKTRGSGRCGPWMTNDDAAHST